MWLVPIISAIAGMYSAHKQKKAQEQASAGANLKDLMPQLQALMAQMQQHGQQNYQGQQQRATAAQPLRDAMAKMTMGMLPRSAQPQPLPMPGMSAPQGMPGQQRY